MSEKKSKELEAKKNKTCICEGFCEYKFIGLYIGNCGYSGYCDYKTPRDSREYIVEGKEKRAKSK